MATFFMSALLLAELALPSGIFDTRDGQSVRIYVGTYTNGDSKGIYVLEMDLETGELTSPRLAVEAVNPSFLALHPSDSLLFAVSEVGDWHGQETGAVSAFRIDPANGALKLLSQQGSGGGAPCYLVVDRYGKFVLVANYSGGSVASLPIGEDGRLGEAVSVIRHSGSSVNPDRQEGPHAHSINVDAANRFAVAADLGLDQLLVYNFDSDSGSLTPDDPPSASVAPGAGPRHLAFHPNGKLAYVVNELDLTVTVFAYDQDAGTLTEIQTISTLPDSLASEPPPENYSTAEIQVHPSGQFVYASNRGHNSIAVFSVDEITGRLTAVEYAPTLGRNPRHFGIDPTGQFLIAANQNSHNLVIFRIGQKTGYLEPTGQTVDVPRPVCVKFLTLR